MAGGGEEEEYSEWQQTGGNGSRNGAFIKYRWQGVWAGVVAVVMGGDAQFGNAITVDLPESVG